MTACNRPITVQLRFESVGGASPLRRFPAQQNRHAMAATRSVTPSDPSPSSALCVGSAASAAPHVGRYGVGKSSGLAAGGGGGCPFDGSRMADATAVPIAGRGPEGRLAEASHKRHLTVPTGFSASRPLRVGGLSFGGGQNRAVSPPATVEIAGWGGNRDRPAWAGIVTPNPNGESGGVV